MKGNWNNKTFFIGMLVLANTLGSAADHGKTADWKIDMVDQSGAAKFVSMKVDANGDVHVAYIPEVDGHPLKYAFWDHRIDRWFNMTITAVASFCTLTLDSQQRAHISFADHGTGTGARLRYAHWDGATWQIEAVSPRNEGTVGYYTSVALDASDKPSFSYYEYLGPSREQAIRLRSVFRQENYWQVLMVDPQQGSGKFNSMAIDSRGLPHIAYANVAYQSSGLRYASWTGNSWKTEWIEGLNGPTPIYSVSMILDKNDIPHIVYTEVGRRLVKYATQRDGKWIIQPVDTIKKEGYPDRNGIALDNNGDVYLSYYDAGVGCLKIATSRNGRWYVESLDRDYSGFTNSLQIHDDTIWVAYGDDGEGGLRVARKPVAGFGLQ